MHTLESSVLHERCMDCFSNYYFVVIDIKFITAVSIIPCFLNYSNQFQYCCAISAFTDEFYLLGGDLHFDYLAGSSLV